MTSNLNVLHYLVPLVVSVAMLNVVLFGVLWKNTKSEYYMMLFRAWVFGLLSFIVHIFIANAGPLAHAGAFTLVFPFSYFVSLLLSQLTEVKFPRRFLLTMYVLIPLIALVLFGLNIKYHWVIFLITTASCAGPLIVSLRVIMNRWKSISIILRCYTFILFLYGLHNLDYVLVFEDIYLITAGFTFGVLLASAFTVFGLAAVMEKIGEDKTKLELELKYRAHIANAAKLTAIGEMAGGVAHEINNPLQIIQGLADLIERAFNKEEIKKEYIVEKLGRLKINISRIAEIVAGLIAFSREGGKEPLQTGSLKYILDRTFDLYGKKLQGDGVTVKEFSIDPSLMVYCKFVEITQVLINLLNNAKDAVKFSNEKWIEILIRDEGDKISVLIIDSGPGVPSEIKDKIFQPFFSTKDINEGTGLGLSISKGIAQSQGGDLYLCSKSINTCFVLTLPKSDKILSV